MDRTIGRTRSLSNLLDAALTASLAQTGIQQNEDMRKISAWVAMAAVPTLIAGVYGMNFDRMPELDSALGYPLTLAGNGLHRARPAPILQAQRLVVNESAADRSVDPLGGTASVAAMPQRTHHDRDHPEHERERERGAEPARLHPTRASRPPD